MPIYTANFNLAKPLVNNPTDQDQWGTQLNSDMDIIDAALKVARDDLVNAKTASYLLVEADRNKVLIGNSSGAAFNFTLPPPATVGNGYRVCFKKSDASANSITILPNASETIDGSSSLSLNMQNQAFVLVTNGINWFVSANYNPQTTALNIGTVINSTSGSNLDFTVPSGTKRINFNFSQVSVNNNIDMLLQIGPSSTPETSGYLGSAASIAGTAAGSGNYTNGFGIPVDSTTDVFNGSIQICLMDASTNTWCCSGIVGKSNNNSIRMLGFSKSLAGNIGIIRLTTVGAAASFDLGKVNISYEL